MYRYRILRIQNRMKLMQDIITELNDSLKPTERVVQMNQEKDKYSNKYYEFLIEDIL